MDKKDKGEYPKGTILPNIHMINQYPYNQERFMNRTPEYMPPMYMPYQKDPSKMNQSQSMSQSMSQSVNVNNQNQSMNVNSNTNQSIPNNQNNQNNQNQSIQNQSIQNQSIQNQNIQNQNNQMSPSNMIQQNMSNVIQSPSNVIQNNSTLPDKTYSANRGFKTRMRVSKACDRCRTQKIKCSGTHPCVSCVKYKKECMYSTTFTPTIAPEFREEMPAKRQKVILGSVEPFGLPVIRQQDSGYVEHLENRIQYLEGLLAQNSVEMFRPVVNNEPDVRNTDTILVSPSDKWRYSRRHQNMLVVELCRQMFSGLSEESQKQVNLPRTQYFGWNLSGCRYISPEELPEIPSVQGLDTERYLQYFFREINPLYAILHESVFMEQVEVYNKQMGAEQPTTSEYDTIIHQTRLFSALLFLVYALSIRFLEFSHPRGPSFDLLRTEELLFKYAHRVVSILSFEWESFELTQAWLLIALYLRVTHRQTSAYHALGQAIFIAKSMGLGQAVPPVASSTNYERLKAKRIFWSVYTMDRLSGLQTGRYCGLTDADADREFPSLEYAQEAHKDTWVTLESFAMLHLARISNLIHTMQDDNPNVLAYQQINMEIAKFRTWMNENGFANDDIYSKRNEPANSLVRVQVKMHYYDLLMCVHGKLMFNYIGRRVPSQGLRIEMVLEACHGVVELMDKCNKNNTLYVPWFLSLLCLFNVGVYSITMINGGVHTDSCRFMLQKTIRLISTLKNAPVRNSEGKIVLKERFKMAKECLWALKMANRILILKFEESIRTLKNIGIDHGSSDVNKQTFTQIGVKTEAVSAFNQLLEEQRQRGEREVSSESSGSPEADQSEMLNNGDYEVGSLLGNLQWFDQWMEI